MRQKLVDQQQHAEGDNIDRKQQAVLFPAVFSERDVEPDAVVAGDRLGLMHRRALAEQLVDRDAEQRGQLRQDGNIRAGKIVLPLADRLRADADVLGKLLLRHTEALAVKFDAFSDGRLIHVEPPPFYALIIAGRGAKVYHRSVKMLVKLLNRRLSRPVARKAASRRVK